MNRMEDENWAAIERVLAGEASPEDETRVARWEKEDAGNAAFLDALRNAPRSVQEARAQYDSRAAWAKVQPRLRSSQRTSDVVRLRSRRVPQALLRAAAGIVLVVAATIAVIRIAPSVRDGSALIAGDVSTAPGQRATVRLSDGSVVVLGPASRIAQAHGEGAERRVELSGSAYFDVVRDETRPFVVTAGGTETRVLGTTFSVRAYADGAPLSVVVESGRVSVRAPNASSPVILDPGQQAVVEGDGSVAVHTDVDVQRQLGWRTGTLSFDGATLREVAAEIRRWYGIVVVIEDPTIADYPLTASFAGASVEDVLSVTSRSLGIQHTFDGRTAVFRP